MYNGLIVYDYKNFNCLNLAYDRYRMKVVKPVSWVMNEPVKIFSQSIVDDSIKVISGSNKGHDISSFNREEMEVLYLRNAILMF